MSMFFAAGCAPAQATRTVQLLPGDLQWRSSPKLHSLQTATLIGDPARPGPYVQRIKLPPNHRLEPHSHPNSARMVTVLSGTLYFGYGRTFDEAKLRAMTPGSFFTEPANMPHYARTGDQEVVLQLNADGPDGTTYVAQPKP
jgi:quercetin dioxygenase-like cupin family protein